MLDPTVFFACDSRFRGHFDCVVLVNTERESWILFDALNLFPSWWHKLAVDEQQLVSALRSQDPAGVREVVGLYGDRLLRSAFLLCGSEAEAQDLVQDTYVQALCSIHRFKGGARIYTWLHSILLNLVRHYHRDRRRLIYDEDFAKQAVTASEEPSRLDVEIGSTALAAALRQLTPTHREVLVMRFYEEMKLQEIAGHLGISKGTVKSRLHYAIGEMQKLLPGELNLFGPHGTEQRR